MPVERRWSAAQKMAIISVWMLTTDAEKKKIIMSREKTQTWWSGDDKLEVGTSGNKSSQKRSGSSVKALDLVLRQTRQELH